MGDAVAMLEAVSMPVRAGWVVLLAWTLLQLMWRRRARIPAFLPLPPMPPEPRRRPVKPVAHRGASNAVRPDTTRPIVYGQPSSLPEA